MFLDAVKVLGVAETAFDRPSGAAAEHGIEFGAVEVHLADAAAPTLLRENDKSSALYVLMPMRMS